MSGTPSLSFKQAEDDSSSNVRKRPRLASYVEPRPSDGRNEEASEGNYDRCKGIDSANCTAQFKALQLGDLNLCDLLMENILKKTLEDEGSLQLSWDSAALKLPLDPGQAHSMAISGSRHLAIVWNIFMFGDGISAACLENATKLDSQEATEEVVKTGGKIKKYPNAVGKKFVYMRGRECRRLVAQEMLNRFKDQDGGVFPQVTQAVRMFIGLFLDQLMGAAPRAFRCIFNVFEICLWIIPNIFDFGGYLDLLSEFSRILPIRSLPLLVNFLGNHQAELIEEYRKLEQLSKGEKRKMQTFGAKFVGLVKTLEQRLSKTSEMHHIFVLRRLLVECLPLTHAGVTNKFSVQKHDDIDPPVDLRSAWQELSMWESSAPAPVSYPDTSSSSKQPAAVGLMNRLWKSPPDGHTGGSRSSALITDNACPYSVYEAYSSLHWFLLNPSQVVEKGMDSVQEIVFAYSSILRYFSKKDATASGVGFFDGKATIRDVSTAAAFREAIDEPFFRREFLFKSCLALQTLTVPHKREGSIGSQALVPTIKRLDEKVRKMLIDLRAQVFQSSSSLGNGFESTLETLLGKEYLWIMWKQGHCSESVLSPHHNDSLELTEVKGTFKDFGADFRASAAADLVAEKTKLNNFKPFFMAWESVMLENPRLKHSAYMEKGDSLSSVSQALPRAGSESLAAANNSFSADESQSKDFYIESPQLLRQAEEWYISGRNPASKNYEDEFLASKLSHKLKDYRIKLKDDADPQNEIEETERSKNDALFKFRLHRLFHARYQEAYTLRGSTPLKQMQAFSGKVEALEALMDEFDEQRKEQDNKAHPETAEQQISQNATSTENSIPERGEEEAAELESRLALPLEPEEENPSEVFERRTYSDNNDSSPTFDAQIQHHNEETTVDSCEKDADAAISG